EQVDQIAAGSPAMGQLMPGDRIVSVDGVTGSQQEIADQINSHECAVKDGAEPKDGCVAAEPATVVVDRNGQLETMRITPVYDAEVERNRLGFAFGIQDVNPSVGEAAE